MPHNHFDFIAGLYNRVGRFRLEEPWLRLLALSRNDLLLDAGGGTGRVAAELRGLVRDVFLVDISLGMLRRATGKGLDAVNAPLEFLPFSKGGLERIIMVDTLHHVNDQHKTIIELKRVLAPRGRILIVEPNIRKWQVKLVAFGEKLLLMRSHFLTAEEIISLLSAHDLRVSVTSDAFNIFLVAEKLW